MTSANSISDQFIDQIVTRLQENKRVRRNLPIWGRIHIDRQLPFLCVYRKPTRRPDAGTERLIMGQPAYAIASAQKSLSPSLAQLTQGIVTAMSQVFGSVLLVEIWAGVELEDPALPDGVLPEPTFKIFTSDQALVSNSLDTLENELGRITLQQKRAKVNIVTRNKPTPPRLSRLLPSATADALNCNILGIEIRPLYRQAETDEILPLIHQSMIRDFNSALQRTFFTFTRTQTKYKPRHHQMLGRRATVKAVWKIDKQLADISNSFDYLLQVTPVNADEAWSRFKRNRFEKPPVFRYRPHMVDPSLLKRQLWNIRVEQVEDPTIQHLFREKRKELDVQISMLGNINKREFLLGSLQLYGNLDDRLVATAEELLRVISPHLREKSGKQKLDANAFAKYARKEIKAYQQTFTDFDAQVRIQSNIVGLMVSQGNLLIGSDIKISASRAEALLAHEVGVHVLTYFNGLAQPFNLLCSGLAGYEELQEGLAVLAEYLVGGLSKPRLRLLAARVVATNCLIGGASFIDTFRLLRENYGFKQRVAFNLTMRIYRAGGLTKDAVYLRGLLHLLDYLRDNSLDDLHFVGKIAIDHVPIIQELQRRQVLQAPSLRPHFLNHSLANSRLEKLAQGLSALDLTEGKPL
jgi:uncharacterized protein (TIGR02421 family)